MELDAWVTASLGGGSKGLGVPPLGDPLYSGADAAERMELLGGVTPA